MSRKLDLTNNKFGIEKRQEILDGISEYGTYLPEGVDYDDIDRGVIDFFKEDINLVINDEAVPVFFMTIQKWTDFTRTWNSSDEYKDVRLPFISIVREPDIQPGTNQNKYYNIPGRRGWTYHKVPTMKNGRVGMDLYKVPQPTPVDMTFQVRFFANRMSELNKLNNEIQRRFDSIQHYVTIKGHPMPLTLEAVGDESKVDDIDGRKYYVQLFEIMCSGYIMNEKDFIITPTVDRTKLTISAGGSGGKLEPKLEKKISDSDVTYNVNYNVNSSDYLSIKINEDTQFSTTQNTYNITNITYKVNGEPKTLGFTVKRNDVLEITIDRTDPYSAFFELVGTLG